MSNALPELVHGAGAVRFELRKIPLDETGMSPRQIWCNESQSAMCWRSHPNAWMNSRLLRARALPVCGSGVAIEDDQLIVHDTEYDNDPVNMSLQVLLGKPPKMTRNVLRETPILKPFDTSALDLKESIERVLRLHPLRTRLSDQHRRPYRGRHDARDQMVGPWQVPVADVPSR